MVQEVVFLKVVGDIQVQASVAIEVARHDAKAVPEYAAVDAGGGTHVHEMAVVVPI